MTRTPLRIDQCAKVIEPIRRQQSGGNQLPQRRFPLPLSVFGYRGQYQQKTKRRAVAGICKFRRPQGSTRALASLSCDRRDIIHSASSRTKKAIGATLVGTTRRPSALQGFKRCGVRRKPAPAHRSGETEMVQHLRLISRHAARQDLGLPGIGWSFETLELVQSFEQTALGQQLRAGRKVLPTKKPAHKLRGRYRSDLADEARPT